MFGRRVGHQVEKQEVGVPSGGRRGDIAVVLLVRVFPTRPTTQPSTATVGRPICSRTGTRTDRQSTPLRQRARRPAGLLHPLHHRSSRVGRRLGDVPLASDRRTLRAYRAGPTTNFSRVRPVQTTQPTRHTGARTQLSGGPHPTPTPTTTPTAPTVDIRTPTGCSEGALSHRGSALQGQDGEEG